MMHATCLNSAVSLRCRDSRLFNDSTYFFDARFESNPLLISSSSSSLDSCCCCCCCCASDNSSIYNRLPRINPRFLYNGLRQSTLIQFSPRRSLIFHGSRRQSCNYTSSSSSLTDSDRNYYYEKLYSFKEKRKLGKGKFSCKGLNDEKRDQFFRYESNDDDFVDDVEILLDLLTEEVGFENIGVRERKVRKQIEKKKKDPRCVVDKTKNVRSVAVDRDSKRDKKAVEEYRRVRNEKREEEKGTFVKGVNREHRKEGSSCSSYYSVSSKDEFESDNDVEIEKDNYFVRGESSSEHKDDKKKDSYGSYNEEKDEKVERRQEFGKEKSEVLKKNTAETYYGNQEWRKKSEKKLNVDSSSQHQSNVSVNIKRNSQLHRENIERITDQSQLTMEMDNKVMESISSSQNQYNDNESSSQHQSNVSLNRNSQQHRENVERITDQSQSTMKMDNKVMESNSSSQTQYNINENKLIASSVQELKSDYREETSDRVTREDVYRKQSNVISEASRVHANDTRIASSSSSSLEARMKNTEDTTTAVSNRVEDRREEKHQRIDHLTTLNESKIKSQQIPEISDTRITNIENTSVSRRKSDTRVEKQELHLETSASTEKVNISQQVAVQRKNIEEENISSTSSGVELVKGTTELMKTGRRTTKASSFHVGMPKESSSSYKALKLNPERTSQETNPHGATTSSSRPIITHEEKHEFIGEEDAISSADKQQKSSSQFVGEFVTKAKHELSTTSEVHHEAELVYEDAEQHELKSSGSGSGSGDSQQKVGPTGPADEMWHETVNPQPLETNASDNKRSGRSLWNVIGDVVKLRWVSPRSETNTPKSGSGGKALSSQSTGSETWFSGHEHEEMNEENVKTGSVKSRSRSKKEATKEKVQIHEGLDSPLLSSSSKTNPNQGSSSSNRMSPSVTEESSFPLPAIRMRRSPVVKRSSGADETDVSGSGKLVTTEQQVPEPSREISPATASGSGKMVISEQQVPERSSEVSPPAKVSGSGKMVIMEQPEAHLKEGELKRRKLARIDQVAKDRFDEWEEAYTFEAQQRKNDELFMREALLEAKKAADVWEVPVGAVLVQDGKIIARGYNLVEELRDSTAHAEMICIREASTNLRSWRLSGTTLYVTLEPCPMCAGAILQSRIDKVVWGAPNKLLGADGSWIRLFPDGEGGNGSSDKPAPPVHPFHPNMAVRRGVLSSECADVMQQFFQLRRKKKEKKPEAEPPTPPPPSCLPITHHHPSKFLSKMHDAFNIMFCL